MMNQYQVGDDQRKPDAEAADTICSKGSINAHEG